jgi:hypothetical protein
MRQISAARRRVVVLAGSMAAMSGAVPLLVSHHPLGRWFWLGMVAGLLVGMVVLLIQRRRNEGCA